MATAYGKKAFWDDRYTREATSGSSPMFDWYGRFAHFKRELCKYIRKQDYILIIGCGNSRMAEEMYQAEYTSIASVDFSEPVIKQMKDRYQDKTTLSWQVMDVVEKLNFPDGYFDVTLDKGCLDSVLCGESSTNNISNAIYNIIRVLKPQGIFMLISHWGPEKWLGYLEHESYNWKVTVLAVPRPIVGVVPTEDPPKEFTDPSEVHYIYVCHKQGDKLL